MWKRIRNKISNGSIILKFIMEPKNTADSLDGLIKNIKSQGFELLTVSELIYKDNYVIDNNGMQIKTNI